MKSHFSRIALLALFTLLSACGGFAPTPTAKTVADYLGNTEARLDKIESCARHPDMFDLTRDCDNALAAQRQFSTHAVCRSVVLVPATTSAWLTPPSQGPLTPMPIPPVY